MQFESLRYFLAVARCGSIASASKQLGVAGSAISRQIANLEEEFECVLFDRLPRGMYLSEAGNRLAENAKVILRHLESANFEIQNLKGIISGNVRVACTTEFVPVLSSLIATDFASRFPDIRIDLIVSECDAIIEKIKRSDYDIGLLLATQVGGTVKCACKRREKLVAVEAIRNTDSASTRFSIEHLFRSRLALMPSETGSRKIVDDLAVSFQKPLKIVYCSNQLASILSFILEADSVAVLPGVVTEEFGFYDRFTAIPVSFDDQYLLYSHVIVSGERSLAPAATEFLKIVSSWMSVR